jgi:hypothetical protein
MKLAPLFFYNLLFPIKSIVQLAVPCAAAVGFSSFRFDDGVLAAAGVAPFSSSGWAGEIIRLGLPVVLAPTVGVAGAYCCLRRVVPLPVAGIEEIGIIPTSATK